MVFSGVREGHFEHQIGDFEVKNGDSYYFIVKKAIKHFQKEEEENKIISPQNTYLTFKMALSDT